MNKINKLSLIPIITTSIVAPIALSASCKNNKRHDLDYYFSEEAIMKNGYYTPSKEEKTMIQNFLNKNISSLQQIKIRLKDGISDNEYLLDADDFHSKPFELRIKDKNNIEHLYKFKLDAVNLSEQLSDDKPLDHTHCSLETKRTFSFTVLNSKNKLLFRFKPLYKMDKKLTLPTIVDMEAKFDKSIAKPLYIEWSKETSWCEATINKWFDGDTPEVTIGNVFAPNFSGVAIAGETNKVRIDGIDTPEKKVGSKDASPWEYSFADASSRFAKSTLVPGTKVRLFMTGKDAFGRWTADIFFGDKFQYSYATEITRHGFTLPMNGIESLIKIKNPHSLEHYTAIWLADAMNDAWTKRRGFFKIFHKPWAISRDVYKIKPNTGYQIYMKDSHNSVYKYKDHAYPNGNIGSLDPSLI